MLHKIERTTRANLVPDVERFTQWTRYVRATAYAIRFVKIIQKREFAGGLTEEDILQAEAAIIQEVQRAARDRVEFTDLLRMVAPFVDERGVLRMRGRAARCENVPFTAKYPMIVGGDHRAITLLVQHYHRLNFHQNTTSTINELRQKIVMPRMQTVVKRIVNECRWCRVKKARPLIPQMSALPLCRMAMFMPPFTFTGVDYFGPFDVLIGRTRKEKRYGVLFTCLTTRAIYLEVCYSLTTQSCCAVLDSLVARRGLPVEFHSDNATCFVGAAKEYVAPNGRTLTWRFIPPRCPAMGGAWERLVGATKRALEGMPWEKTPTEETIRRLFVNAERLVNSRPLTEIPVDIEEEDCLTPNHFLLGSSNGVHVATTNDWDARASLREWDKMVNHFWEKWAKEYLPKVSVRPKWHQPTQPLAVGDLVFLCDDDHRRGWLRAEVTGVKIDKESCQVRDLTVRTADNKIFRRAAANVAPIQVARDAK